MNNSRNFAYGKPGLFLAKKTLIPIAVVSILGSHPCLAQITPDTTLGNQNSRVITDVNIKGSQADLIEGGIQRGSNLYHSFLEFNVNNGQRVYFANPTGVDNILSRVTGSNRSEIFGTLGVNGAANLFLLNPKGIIFGPNAQLDIQGSFLATTANSFVFPDGSEFSATNPQAPPLLTMSVPVGVQFGSQPTASITNEGDLVTGKDLTLNAGNLDLQGTLQAGGNLKLQAQDSLKVRDSASKAFIAAAGGNLLARGDQEVDIYALNHPDSGFYSGGDMVLKSENTIGGDAHFWAGGNFRIENLNGDLGNLFSPDDPVIRATGDVSFDSYTGASLHILAGGSVNIDGDINITGVDETGNSLKETVTLSDGTTINIDGSETPTLDIRAGVDTNYIGSPNFTPNLLIEFNPQNPTTTNTPTNANITINGNITNYGGLIFLTNQYQPNPQLSGNIITKEIYSGGRNIANIQNGGNIVIQSKGDITAAKIYSGIENNYGNAGNAGNIIVQATDNIRVGATDPNNPDVEGAINASILAAPSSNPSNNDGKYNAGNAGKIQLTSTQGNITVIGGLFTNSTASGSSAGNTGDITLQALQGKVEVTANGSGAIVTRTKATDGQTGNAGNITIDAKVIKIEGKGRENNKNDLDITSESALTGNSGKITFISQTPLELNNLTIGTDARDGNGGNIEINAPSLTLTNSQITTKTSGTGKAGNIDIYKPKTIIIDNSKINTDSKLSENAGYIRINATGQVSILNGSKISSEGNNGNIVIDTGSLFMDNQNLQENENSQINTNNTTASGNAGYIQINASDQVSILNGSEISSQGNNGWIIIGNSYQPKSIILDNSNITTNNTNNTTGSGDAGYISIQASEEISILNGSKISSEGNYGYINIFTGSLSLTNGAQINSSLTSRGSKVGTIDIKADSISLQGNPTLGKEDVNQTGIFTQISKEGELLSSNGKGNITINTDKLTINDGARVSADSYGKKGDAGDITVNAQQIELKNQGRIISVVRETGDGNSGNIEINSRTLSITDNDALISVSNRGRGNAGNVTINASESVLLERTGRISSSVRSGATGKSGNIDIKTNFLAADGGTIEATNDGEGDSGNIKISTDSLSLNQNSGITTDSKSPGKAGNITINASDQLSILEGSKISSQGSDGNINITTGSLSLNQNSGINTNNDSGNAGDINITTNNLLLRRGSKISTTAGKEGTRGNGGSITINAKDGFVVAVPSEDSNIIANAFGGNGGKIEINANRILGFQNQGKLSPAQLKAIENNGISDISASSDVGQNGEVSLNTLSIDPTQGLVTLPTNLVDTSRLIAQGCGSNSNVAKGKSEFVITGRGGLPPSPDDTLKPGAILPEWVVNNTESNGNNSANMPERNLKQLSANNADTLVEAVGMVRSANGEIVLTAQPTTATGLQSGLSSQVCNLVQGDVRQ